MAWEPVGSTNRGDLIADLPGFLSKASIEFATVPAAGQLPLVRRFEGASGAAFFSQLRRGAEGSVVLFWLETDGRSFLGTAESPLSIRCATWSGSWGASRLLASGLTDVFNADFAVADGDRMLAVFTRNGVSGGPLYLDVYAVERVNGGAVVPVRLTPSGADHRSARAVYDQWGKLAVCWVEGPGDIVGIRDSLAAKPTRWASGLEVPLSNFDYAQWVSKPGGMALVWAGQTNVHVLREPLNGAPEWMANSVVFDTAISRGVGVAAGPDGVLSIVAALHGADGTAVPELVTVPATPVPALRVERLANGDLRFVLSAPAGTYALQTSADLRTWTDAQAGARADGGLWEIAPRSAAGSFFRSARR